MYFCNYKQTTMKDYMRKVLQQRDTHITMHKLLGDILQFVASGYESHIVDGEHDTKDFRTRMRLFVYDMRKKYETEMDSLCESGKETISAMLNFLEQIGINGKDGESAEGIYSAMLELTANSKESYAETIEEDKEEVRIAIVEDDLILQQADTDRRDAYNKWVDVLREYVDIHGYERASQITRIGVLTLKRVLGDNDGILYDEENEEED